MTTSTKDKKPSAASFAVALLIAGLLTGCGESSSTADKAAKPASPPKTEVTAAKAKDAKGETEKNLVLSQEEIERAGIKVQKLEERDKTEQVVATATIQANQDKLARVAARVPGRIVKVFANLGDRVKTGQPLALIDSIELGEANSAYLQASSEAGVAHAAFERAQRLNTDNIIPEKDFLRAKAEHEKSLAALRAASDKLRMLGVEPGKTSGSVFPITAPFPGAVVEKKAVLGELAQPDKPLFTVADLSTLWIETDLFEKDLAKIKPGASAAVTVSAYPGEIFKGRLTYVSSLMDKESRTVKARVELPNADGRLKPEMFATVAISSGAGVKALFVPDAAILLMQGQPTVFVLEKSGFEARPVEIGERFQGQAVIKSGIEEGEDMVVSGAYALKARLLKSQIGDAD